MEIKKGIDISQWQGTIFPEIWKDIKQKCDYVIIRFGYRGYGTGELKLDSQFKNNLSACKKYKIPFGLYFFTQAITEAEAISEARMIANTINIKDIVYPVYCDTETANDGNGRADKLDKITRTRCVKAFCDEIKRLGGKTGIYAGYYWLKDNLNKDELSKYDIWCPCYLKECLYKGKNLTAWQFSSTNAFKIKGFGNNLDCNYCYKDYESEKGITSSIPEQGISNKRIVLNNADLYASASAKTSVCKKSGTFYIYSDNVVNDRIRITTSEENINKSPASKYVTGWINVSIISAASAQTCCEHIVKRGESLYKIAAEYLGSGKRYPEIKKLNGLTTDIIYIGQVLKIPKNSFS